MDSRDKETIKYIKIFLIIVFVAAVISLAYRGVVLFKNSTFKYDTFNLLVLTEDAYVAHVDKKEKQLLILKFPGFAKSLVGYNRLFQSLILGFPIDGSIQVKNNFRLAIDDNFMEDSTVLALLLNSRNFRFQNINSVDVIKIFLYTKQVDKQDRKMGAGNVLQGSAMYGLVDKSIFNEKKSVQIVNASKVDGLGAKVAAVLESAGYNVISTKTGENPKSAIKADDLNSVSVKRAHEIFGILPTRETAGSIADITIILGQDINKQLRKE